MPDFWGGLAVFHWQNFKWSTYPLASLNNWKKFLYKSCILLIWFSQLSAGLSWSLNGLWSLAFSVFDNKGIGLRPLVLIFCSYTACLQSVSAHIFDTTSIQILKKGFTIAHTHSNSQASNLSMGELFIMFNGKFKTILDSIASVISTQLPLHPG